MDITSTWDDALSVLLMQYENPATRSEALLNLRKMAEVADLYVAEQQKLTRLNLDAPRPSHVLQSIIDADYAGVS